MNIHTEIEAIQKKHVDAMLAEVLETLQKGVNIAVAGVVADIQKAVPASREVTASAPAKKSKGTKAAPKKVAVTDKKLLAAVKKAPGKRLEELAEMLGVPSKTLKLPARRLANEGLVKKRGQARATTYTAKK